MALSSKLSLHLVSTLTSALDLSTATDVLDYPVTYNLVTGTGTTSGNADMQWSDTRTLTASATEDLDFAGSLTNALGSTQTFARIKAIIVTAAAANTNNVNIIRPAANGVPLFLAASDGTPVLPGGTFMWVAPAAGVVVTAGTGDLVTFTNSAGSTSVTYSIIVLGASA
jgi:hypothetical protein